MSLMIDTIVPGPKPISAEIVLRAKSSLHNRRFGRKKDSQESHELLSSTKD